MKVGDEVELRQGKLQQIGDAKMELERRAQTRYNLEKAAYDAKQALGFRQFLLRRLKTVTGEWALVCTAYNLKRLQVLMG